MTLAIRALIILVVTYFFIESLIIFSHVLFHHTVEWNRTHLHNIQIVLTHSEKCSLWLLQQKQLLFRYLLGIYFSHSIVHFLSLL